MPGMMTVADIPQSILTIYSKKILMEAEEKMYYRGLVDYKLEFGTEKGNTIRFLKQDYLTGGGAILTEETPIPEEKFTQSEKFITMGEMGNKVSISRLAQQSSYIDLMELIKRLLVSNARDNIDNMLQDTYFNTANVFYAQANATSGTLITDTASLMTDKIIDSALEMASDLRIPKFQGPSFEYYVMMCDYHTIRQLRAQVGGRFIETRKYTDPSDFRYGTVGMYEGIVFVENPRIKTKLAVGAGAGAVDVHKSLLIGANAVGYGEGVPLSLYPITENEYFRKNSFAWYTINGAGILMDNIIELNTLDGIPA
jgi:N4-gp56 family major capsid protein